MEICIHSVHEYIEKCFANPALKNPAKQVFYRGVNEIFRATPHIPSIYFPGGFIEKEDIIFREALSVFPEELLAQKSTVERLIFMQHYRFPTRIMDISKNPLVSLFFACFSDGKNETLKKDGMVYLYAVPVDDIKYCDSDAVSVIANIAKRPYAFSIKNIRHLDRDDFNKEDEVLYLVHEIGEEKPYFKNLVLAKDINSVVCLRPRMNNPRIIRQDGYFFLFGIDNDKKNCARLDTGWIGENQFIVPFDAKEGILRELDILNINEAFVYPDYEHISRFIKTRRGKGGVS
jgi:hypothetical protein